MQKIYITILLEIVKRLTGKEFIESVRYLVQSYIRRDLDGDTKRAQVYANLRAQGYAFANWLLNLAIESVYAYLKLKRPELFAAKKAG